MPRVRISTTVDEGLLARCRTLTDEPDSRLIDRALRTLIEAAEADAERRALTEHPYDDDDELAWTVGDGPPLPYDGEVPKEVLARARARRRRR